MKIIATNNAPAAIGPYSQGIVSRFAASLRQIPWVNPPTVRSLRALRHRLTRVAKTWRLCPLAAPASIK